MLTEQTTGDNKHTPVLEARRRWNPPRIGRLTYSSVSADHSK